MRWWEWLKKGWNSYTEAAQVELMAYLPTRDEVDEEHTEDGMMYNDHQDAAGKNDKETDEGPRPAKG